MTSSECNQTVSILTNSGQYPSSSAYYSPDYNYPEYPFEDVSSEANNVYSSVRNLLWQAGLDSENYGTTKWNPLGVFIRPGSQVFVLPNFVFHRRPNESLARFEAKCTHGAVLRALIDYVFIATGPSAKVSVGNAPLQSCIWSKVIEDTGAARVRSFYEQHGWNLRVCDLRGTVRQEDVLGRSNLTERRDDRSGISFDLGIQSLLSELDTDSQRYRVAGYDPAVTETYHRDGHHKYVLNREIIEAAVIISVPKLKTHEKVGVTCALKGLVGTIYQKECLAHHRFGSPKEGGDEYPKPTRIARMLSTLHDSVQSYRSKSSNNRILQVIEIIERSLARVYSRTGGLRYGAWYGNDTAWRMTLDIAKLVNNGTVLSQVGDYPARSHLVLVDGIVGGEGDGPLNPQPVHSGVLIFSDNAALADYAACSLMGYDPQRLPLIRCAFSQAFHSVFSGGVDSVDTIQDGERVRLSAPLKPHTHKYITPRGWRGYL
jgi:uncharacterized protein (DUF362 family)